MKKDQMIKYYTTSILWSLITLVVSGSMAQTFLLEYGLSEEKVTSLFSIMQMAQVMTILCFSKFSDNLDSIVKTLVKTHLLDIPLCLVFMILCVKSVENQSIVFLILLLTGGIFSISAGINNVLAYKLPYKVMDMAYFGKFIAISGTLVGIFNVAFGMLSQKLQSVMGYIPSMKYIVFCTLLFIPVYLVATGTMKESPVAENFTTTKEKINILKYKIFTALVIPNVFRGFCAGMVGMTITIGYFTGLIDGSTANYVIIITNVMHIVSSFAFSKITQTIPDKYVLLGTSVVVAVLLPLMTIGNTTLFLLLYTVLYFFYNVLNNAVPVTVAKIVDYKIAGQYSSGRMLLNTLGISIAGFVSIPMFKAIGVVPTLIIAGAMQVISGAGYYLVLKNREK